MTPPGAPESAFPVGSNQRSPLRSRTIAEYLSRQKMTSEQLQRFLQPRLSELTPPYEMKDRGSAAARLARAIRGREKIVVFGDYDCDGMTATAILSDVIEELGGQVAPALANRFDGGYGVSESALQRIVSMGPSLVVTCDCGSSDHPTLEQLTRSGVDVIVIDHHLVPERPLPVLSFLNPHRPECGFPEKGLASCGLALSVAAALRTELGADLDVRKWLDLVAIGSIADVAPLRGDNRILVRAGLDAVRKAERPGLRALLDLIGVDRRYPVLASDIAFRVAPRLNAPGRLGAPDVALSLLREKDSHKAQLLAAEVESQCQTRRTHQATILEEAEAQVEELGLLDAPALVLGKQGWNPGIVGIVAGRLAEKYARPALVVGFEDEIGRGSLRGPAGFPLFDALSSCSAHLCKFGGHQAAAGLEVLHARFLDFRAAFEAACRQHKPTSVPSSVAPLPVHPDDEWSAILSDLYLLEPCGEKNPAPELELDCEIERSTTVRGGHLKLELRCPSGRRLGAFGPNMGNSSTPLEGPAKVIGRLRPDTYRGGEAVELLLTRVDCARL